MIDFALLNIVLYVAFQVNSGLADISFMSGLHTSAVLGKNLLK